MDPILEMGRKYNLVVIEDAAESLGAKYKGGRLDAWGTLPVSASMATRSSPLVAAV